MPDALQPLAAWLGEHTALVVFVAALIDATGIPFPGRVVLVGAGAFAAQGGETGVVALVVSGAAGVAITDHLWYFAGVLGADRLVGTFCRVTFNSELCARKTRDWFERYGAATIILGRFVAGVRLLAWPLARSHGVGYPLFLLFDALGALLWSAVWIGLGWFVGEHALDMVRGLGWVGVAVAAAGVVVVLSVRRWRRSRARVAA
jgi:membrane protein DedA with SNARE-associated domain